MKLLNTSRSIVRIFLGALFILSAVLKLISIDTFEVYIYSFQLCSFTLAAIGARCLIAAEFIIGCALALKVQYRWAWWLATLMTVGFTFFLVYVVLFRNDANCHCFGDLIPIEPLHSIYKNIGILLLLGFAYKQTPKRLSLRWEKDDEGKRKFIKEIKEKDYAPRFQKWFAGLTGGTCLVVLFILFPPNAVYSAIFSENNLVNTTIFDKAYADSSFYLKINDVQYIKEKDTVVFKNDTTRLDIDKGKYVIAIISSGCKYCRQSCDLISNISERNHLDKGKIKFLVWGTDESLSHFMRVTKTWEYEYRMISPYLAIDMVYGNFPTFAYVVDGKIVGAFNYRGVSEPDIVKFLTE